MSAKVDPENDRPVDGPRYVVSLLKDKTRKDMMCFSDVFESDTLSRAEEEAEDLSIDTGLPVLIFDRHAQAVVAKIDLAEASENLD